jgi:glutathione S-transferase
MYTFYYAPGACSLSVHIVLEWVKATYTSVKVDSSSPDYLKVNPAGAVPALAIGSATPLTQCSAILQYLSRQYPKACLDLHEDNEREADLARWAAFLTGDLHPAFFPVFMPHRYTTDTTQDALSNVKAAGLLLVRKKLAILDTQLEGREYFMGSQRTYVDAYSIPMVRWAKNVLPGGLGDFGNVSRHHSRLLKDEAVIRTMTAEGILGR